MPPLHGVAARHAILLTTQKKKFGAQLVHARLSVPNLCGIDLADLGP